MRRRTVIASAVGIGLLLSSRPAMAQRYSEWTAWKPSSDPLVQWRSRIQDWGRNMSAVCLIEFRIDADGIADFRYDLSYQPEGPGSDPGGHRVGTVYRVGRDTNHGNEQILGCRQVNDAVVTRVVRRGRDGAPLQRTTPERTADSSPAEVRTPGAGASPQDVPDMINFPGTRKPYHGPDLGDVRMDSRSLQAVRFESDRLGKRLLDWRPVKGWAQGRPAAIGQGDWAALAAILSPVDRHLLHDVAVDAARHASDYTPDAKLWQFWVAMAQFYEYLATP